MVAAIADNKKIFYWSLAYIAITGAMLLLQTYLFFALPFLIMAVYFVFKRPDIAFFALVFFVPLSINSEEFVKSAVSLFIPTEPLLILLMVIYLMSHMLKPMFDRRIFSSPIFVAYTVYLLWLVVTSYTSMSPGVSFKFLIAHCWLFFPVFIFSAQLFQKKENVFKFFMLYCVAMLIVVLYTLYTHAQYNFAEKPAHWVMSPFFKDHTSYGAILALVFPIVVGLMASRYYSRRVVWFLVVALGLFFVALIYSYTRAAWLSLAGALGIWLIMYFRIRFSTVLIVVFGAAFFLFISLDKILISLKGNTTDSSADFGKHLTSMSNISTDASNVERLNRWDCALSMFREKPFTGWGPGTYQFYYAPFQKPENITIISTYFGDGGNAHSEYLGPLAETGFMGLILFAFVVIVVFYRGFSNYRYIEDFALRQVYIGALLGLATYFMHGFLNNYLDTDKAAVPVWGIAGLITAVDLYYVKKKKA